MDLENSLVSTFGALALTTVLLAGVIIWSLFFTGPKTFNYPIYGAEGEKPSTLMRKFQHQADILLVDAYKKFRGGIFQLYTPDGVRLFLPRKYAQELKGYNREELSGMKALADRHLGQYTTIDHESPYMLNAIKLDLNQKLGQFVTDVQNEVAQVINTTFPACEDWTPVNLNDLLLRIISQASARIFVGPSLNRSKEWLDLSEKFATDVMIGGEKLKGWRPILRPIAQYLIPEVRRIQADHEEAYQMLRPVLEAREKEEAEKGDHYERPNDMLEWIRTRATKNNDKSVDYREQAKIQLLTATAAIHTTRLATLHVLFDLAARPEYIDPLREELQQVLAETDGPLTKQTLTHLKKLDSFMKESQRHNPPSLATFQRKVLTPVKLSNGLELPRGVIVQCNTGVLDEVPESWGDPHAFDGFRFYKLRSKPEDAHKYQFASISLESMEFGLGKDACPGRFFATNQIKIILAHLILYYDLALEKPDLGRPKNFMFEVNVLADPTARLLLKRRA
ncbi:cytochrome P450, putative [Talaromyces stipitatus ATCC 10500]|uniref:Cytochrome P450, putative n=1 Tax=Talaromyces stipitatus (strain ATCC 10500 / CBS 375.48 / QM 6759 / NRRL 1006) TaxID=441959 RepID=B8MI03_TALSN|nr:cytochrome P450, putative [Talaromyces stipitatus ATCC 10500]EED17165.1 cytochrome P450, putative [Talaromyces stipitatus ATCC 10500]